jgi:hypothetical protein
MVAMITAGQAIGIFGVFFLFGLVLYGLSKMTRNIFHNAGYPKLDVYLTGWIGIPVHEFGHALFCIIFTHRINEIKLFTPNSADGSLGYVNHSYHRGNYYQNVGNLFIGAGPIIAGTFALYALMAYLLPNHLGISALLSDKNIEGITLANVLNNYSLVLSFSLNVAAKVFSAANFTAPGFWVFLYLSLCVSSHMALSGADLKGMWQGVVVFVLILFFVNIIPALFRVDITHNVMKIQEYTAGFMGLFILASIISFMNFCVSYLILAVLHYRKFKSLLPIY